MIYYARGPLIVPRQSKSIFDNFVAEDKTLQYDITRHNNVTKWHRLLSAAIVLYLELISWSRNVVIKANKLIT